MDYHAAVEIREAIKEAAMPRWIHGMESNGRTMSVAVSQIVAVAVDDACISIYTDRNELAFRMTANPTLADQLRAIGVLVPGTGE